MDSISSNKVPAINFACEALRPETTSWCSVRTEVRKALEVYGCFEAVFDGKPQLHQDMLLALEQYFDLPLETKIKHNTDTPFDGYPGINPVMPLLDTVAIHVNQLPFERLQRFTNLMWPEGNSSFCDNMYSYMKQVCELEKMVKKMIFESFGVEMYYDSHANSTNYILRLLKYDAPKTKEISLGAIQHKDKSFLSILSQNGVRGLEIQAKDGEWISVEPSASSFIVIVGEVFMAWSNDRLHCPLHRVMMTGDDVRYSMAFFSFKEGMLQIPDEMVDEEHPLLYKPFNHRAFHAFATSKGDQKFDSQIKAFCGV
ncbi:2-oxoglutarate-dependent dioxygenase AOP2 [Thalictrum thalictroides]|uniref:2-oxoglutarate-dependent dioxygenase AOP2 n=1 Tax=Thalictrum thalictroides TaxID=46969 RepID=A0A7J6VVR8_THATH|nr:2-oxoglutarate-dependent dioxygenase AOP2 [Thalictrum thalictroides]